MGIIGKAMVIAAFCGGYLTHDYMHECRKNKDPVTQENPIKNYSDFMFKLLDEAGVSVEPHLVKDYVDKPMGNIYSKLKSMDVLQ